MCCWAGVPVRKSPWGQRLRTHKGSQQPEGRGARGAGTGRGRGHLERTLGVTVDAVWGQERERVQAPRPQAGTRQETPRAGQADGPGGRGVDWGTELRAGAVGLRSQTGEAQGREKPFLPQPGWLWRWAAAPPCVYGAENGDGVPSRGLGARRCPWAGDAVSGKGEPQSGSWTAHGGVQAGAGAAYPWGEQSARARGCPSGPHPSTATGMGLRADLGLGLKPSEDLTPWGRPAVPVQGQAEGAGVPRSPSAP